MNLYEVVNSVECEFIALGVEFGIIIDFTKETVRHYKYGKQTVIAYGEIVISIPDRFKFELIDETDEWINFEEIVNDGCKLSLKKQ